MRAFVNRAKSCTSLTIIAQDATSEERQRQRDKARDRKFCCSVMIRSYIHWRRKHCYSYAAQINKCTCIQKHSLHNGLVLIKYEVKTRKFEEQRSTSTKDKYPVCSYIFECTLLWSKYQKLSELKYLHKYSPTGKTTSNRNFIALNSNTQN